jgi:hypothetical protein
VAHAIAVGQWSVWRWLELAPHCRLGATLETFCELIVAFQQAVPHEFDLGLAAQPLAVKLARKLSVLTTSTCGR